MLALNFAAERAEFIQKYFTFFSRRRVAMPEVIALDLLYSLPRNGVRDDKRRLFCDRLRFRARGDELRNVVTVDFEDMPAESFVLLAQRLERHDRFRVSVDLDVVAV